MISPEICGNSWDLISEYLVKFCDIPDSYEFMISGLDINEFDLKSYRIFKFYTP